MSYFITDNDKISHLRATLFVRSDVQSSTNKQCFGKLPTEKFLYFETGVVNNYFKYCENTNHCSNLNNILKITTQHPSPFIFEQNFFNVS